MGWKQRFRLVLTVAVLLPAGGTWAQAPAPAVAPENQAVKTFATLPTAGATENLCQAADGTIYVSVIDEHKLVKVAADGKVSEFASAPTMAHMLGVGCGEGAVATVAFGKTFRKPNPNGQGAVLDFSDTDTHVLLYDPAGNMTADIAAPKGVGLNGLASAGKGTYLATDSASATIYKVDAAAKTVEPWFKDEGSAPTKDIPIGLNGVRVKNGWAYFSSFPKNGVYKVQIAADGKAQGAPQKVEEGIRVDDFDIGADGSVFFPSGTTLYRVSPTGEVVKLVDPIQGGPAALVSSDGKWVYWPTRGGTAPQRLVRVALP